MLTLIQRQTPLGKAANDKAVHPEDSELSDDSGQRSSDGNSNLSGGGHQKIEVQRLVAYNKEDKPVRVDIS